MPARSGLTRHVNGNDDATGKQRVTTPLLHLSLSLSLSLSLFPAKRILSVFVLSPPFLHFTFFPFLSFFFSFLCFFLSFISFYCCFFVLFVPAARGRRALDGCGMPQAAWIVAGVLAGALLTLLATRPAPGDTRPPVRSCYRRKRGRNNKREIKER